LPPPRAHWGFQEETFPTIYSSAPDSGIFAFRGAIRESEQTMLIKCVAYENGARLSDLAIDEISDYLARLGCFVWVALADATSEELDKMKEEFALHELALEDARHGHQRPKIRNKGGYHRIDGSPLSSDAGFSTDDYLYSSSPPFSTTGGFGESSTNSLNTSGRA
jgi:hypothetical protein